jgi:hypothetical protein
MAVCTIASARAATVGPGGSLRIDSSVSSFHTRTRLSPAARAGWGRPTVATKPKARMSTTPMTVVTLRTAATLSQANPLGRDTADGSGVKSSNPGGGKDRERMCWRVRTCRSASKTLRTGSATGPARPDRRRAVTHNPARGGKSPNQAWTDPAADDRRLPRSEVR